MNARLVSMLLLTSSAAALAAPPPGFDEQRREAEIREYDRTGSVTRLAETNLTETEKRMNAIIVPGIEFRQANICDTIDFFDGVVATAGVGPETNDATRLRIRIDKSGLGDGDQVDCITFNARKVSLLIGLRLVTKIAGLEYRTEGNVVTVYRPKQEANHTSEGIRQPADGSPKPSM
jgi:hypothetical protein